MGQSMLANYCTRFLVIFALTALAACSGGGGDGGDSITSPDLPKGQLQSIAVTCTPGMLSVGAMGQCEAIGTFVQVVEVSDGNFREVSTDTNITNLVNWTSSDPGVVSVDGNGKTTGVGPGTADVNGSLDGVSGTDTVTVPDATLTSITVSCNPSTILVGGTTQCTASGVFDDGLQAPVTRDITDQVDWTSSDGTIATVNDQGVVTGVGAGLATITATSGSVNGSDDVTVRTLNITALEITPGTSTIPPFCTQQYTAIATFDDTSTVDVTDSANIVWASSIADTSVNAVGFATAGPQGTVPATITATYTDEAGNVEADDAVLTVEDTAVASLCVEPAENADPSVATCNVDADFTKPIGVTVPFLAKLVYDSGSFCPLFAADTRVTWTSSDEPTATVDDRGLVTTVDNGETDITATMTVVPVVGSHPLTVGVGIPNPLVEYEVLPDFSCVGFYDAAAGLQESPDLPGSQQMLAEGIFQETGETCDFDDHTTCFNALGADTTWASVEGFWNGTSCEALVPIAGTPLEAAAPGAVNSDGVVTPSGSIRLGTTCVQGTYTGDLLIDGASDIDGGTVLVLPVTSDVLVDDAAELCDALSPLLQLGGTDGGAGFPVQLVSAVAQILNPALTAAFNDDAIPIDTILDQVLGTLSDDLTAQLLGPDSPLEPVIDGLDEVYGGVNCLVGALLAALLNGDDPGAIAACSPF